MISRKTLKTGGWIVGILLVLIISSGFYVRSVLPKQIGETPPLQTELFEPPKNVHAVEGKYIYRSATDLAAMIRSGESTSEEIVMETIAHIKNNNWKYNALVWMNEEETLRQARQADTAVAKGDTLLSLLGVPVTIKEQFLVKGFPSTLNNRMITIYPDEDAALVAQIRKSGAVILGTTNPAFMVADYQTFGEVYPDASNPYDTTRTPGGSTGGGAAALAAGFTTLELSSDLGGSIRQPAAFTGL